MNKILKYGMLAVLGITGAYCIGNLVAAWNEFRSRRLDFVKVHVVGPQISIKGWSPFVFVGFSEGGVAVCSFIDFSRPTMSNSVALYGGTIEQALQNAIDYMGMNAPEYQGGA